MGGLSVCDKPGQQALLTFSVPGLREVYEKMDSQCPWIQPRLGTFSKGLCGLVARLSLDPHSEHIYWAKNVWHVVDFGPRCSH